MYILYIVLNHSNFLSNFHLHFLQVLSPLPYLMATSIYLLASTSLRLSHCSLCLLLSFCLLHTSTVSSTFPCLPLSSTVPSFLLSFPMCKSQFYTIVYLTYKLLCSICFCIT